MAKKPRFFAGAQQDKDKTMDGTETGATDNGPDLIALIKERQYKKAIEAVPLVRDINAVYAFNQFTALHYAAARRSYPLLRALVKREDLNYLAQDWQGRYPSEVALMSGHGDMGEELAYKEKAYAEAHGIQSWPKPEPGGMG